MYTRIKCRMFCTTNPEHGLQPVAEVYENKQLDGVQAQAVTLACGCQRITAVNTKKKGGANGN